MSESPQPPVATPPSHEPPRERPSRVADESVGESLFFTVISALLFLYVGFGMGLRGVSGDAVYDGSVSAFVWMGRIVGVGLLSVAVMLGLRIPLAGVLEALLASIAAVGCLVVAGVWILHADSDGYLVAIFGLLNSFVAWGAWKRLR